MSKIQFVQAVPRGERFISFFSGGKDCGLAIELAIEEGAILFELVHCVNRETNETSWHKQSIVLAQKQADCIGVPIRIVDASPYQKRSQFIKFLKHYAYEGIKYVVCGDLRIGDQAMLEIAVCSIAGLTPVMPLWERNYDEIIELYEKYRMETVITYIEDTDLISVDWLGNKFSREIFNSFSSGSFDPLGEDGEYHTTLVDSRSFIKPVKFRYGNVLSVKSGAKIPVLVEE